MSVMSFSLKRQAEKQCFLSVNVTLAAILSIR